MTTRLFFILFSFIFTAQVWANSAERIVNLEGTNLRISSVTDEKALRLTLSDISSEIVVSITDNFGNVLLTDKLKPSIRISRKYDLSNVEAGRYTLTVSKKTSKILQPFLVDESKLEMLVSERKEKFIPVISLKNKALDLNVLLINYSNVHVKMFDNSGKLVFEETNYVVLTLNKRYDLAKLASGSYVAEITTGDDVFYHIIQL
jgi:hypothetical protein